MYTNNRLLWLCLVLHRPLEWRHFYICHYRTLPTIRMDTLQTPFYWLSIRRKIDEIVHDCMLLRKQSQTFELHQSNLTLSTESIPIISFKIPLHPG